MPNNPLQGIVWSSRTKIAVMYHGGSVGQPNVFVITPSKNSTDTEFIIDRPYKIMEWDSSGKLLLFRLDFNSKEAAETAYVNVMVNK